MKSRRHNNETSPFSLFSFQDIITGVSGIMIFVLLILSLELTIPEDKKDFEEETRKTLFANDPMEIFLAGKLEIANSHTSMTKEDLVNLYLKNEDSHFHDKDKSEHPINEKTADGSIKNTKSHSMLNTNNQQTDKSNHASETEISFDFSEKNIIHNDENNPKTSNEKIDNLISLDINKVDEINKRLNVFRRTLKSDPGIRIALKKNTLKNLNDKIIELLSKKYFLEAQLNKMSKDPYIHSEEVLKDRYIQLNKKVTELMKKIHLYEIDNSSNLTLKPVIILVSSVNLDVKLSDGQKLNFGTSTDGLKDFQTWLQSRDPQKDVLMISIKPSGVAIYRKIDEYIDFLNFKNLTTPVDENMGVDQ